jgi:hypothetical protein
MDYTGRLVKEFDEWSICGPERSNAVWGRRP